MRAFVIAIYLVGAALAADSQAETCVADGTCAQQEDVPLDASILLQTGATTGDILCPTDVDREAPQFWKKFFKSVCQVEMEDVRAQHQSEFDDDVNAASAYRLQQTDGVDGGTSCRVVTFLGDTFGGGELQFDVSPSPGLQTGEDWVPREASAVLLVSGKDMGGDVTEMRGKDICDIFGDAIARSVDLPGAKVEEAFEQVRTDFARVCPNVALTLDTVTSEDTIVAKRGMVDSDGDDQYTFAISVSTPDTDAMSIQVTASSSTTRTWDTTSESQIKHKAENSDDQTMQSHGGTGSPPGSTALMEYEDEIGYAERLDDEPDVTSYIQGRLRVHSVGAPGGTAMSPPGGGAGGGGTAPIMPLNDGAGSTLENQLGPLLVQDEKTVPALCCLCKSCPNPAQCSQGADGFRQTSFIEDDHEEKVREQEEIYAQNPDYAINLLLEVGIPSLGSEADKLPPPIPGDVAKPTDSRVRSAPEYGDNFHSLILPRRTEEDHQLVWAQSRALIETAKAENMTVPASYHYYDHEDTARCFQPAYNQGKCGSCWAFAALGALEKQICLRAQGDVRASLSREMLVRCSEQNGGCEGGNADKAYEDLMEIGGVFSTDCLPYQGKGSKHCPVFAYSWFGQGSAGKTGKFARIDQELQKSCNDHTRYSNRPPQGKEWDMPFRMMYEFRFGSLPNMDDKRLMRFRRNFAKTRARDRVPSWWLYGQEAMKTAVVKYGSIYASFKVRNDFKNRQCPDGCWPPGTVYGEEPSNFKQAACGCGKGHAVHIIGFGEDIWETGKKVPYWLIENSWGDEKHGDVFGEDIAGVKSFGTDPFTEDHPMGIENKCLLAGWAYSALPKSGGCGGNANVNLRDDVKMKDGPPDGMVLSVRVDGVGKGNWSIAKDSQKKFALELDLTPGPHKITFQVYAKNHPKLQSFPAETYGISASALRCRGRGYRYSFTQNDTKAKLDWGRLTRKQLKAQADLLVPTSTDPKYLYGNCSKLCRTGRYSWAKPCLGLLTTWGSCYTQDWAKRSSYMQQQKSADCELCEENAVKLEQQAFAVKNLDNATYLKWYTLVAQSWDAPDEPGWMRMNTGECKIKGGGFVSNALLSATYDIDMPGNKFCDERHSAPFAKGKFVHAPKKMAEGEKAEQRCPPPMIGTVQLTCDNGALYANSHTCSLRPGTADAAKTSRGYYKMLRGINYHGIETGASFGIAEMNRFADRCPTLSWTRWTECNATDPCTKGIQSRSRETISLKKTDGKCVGMMFYDERPCVGPGFCPQVLTRFVSGGSTGLDAFMGQYKTQSTSMQKTTATYATAGSTMLETSLPSCDDAKYWCKITTGKDTCTMYMEGHFQVKKDAEYYFHYLADEGSGELEFNTYGEGGELKPQFKVTGGAAGGGGAMYEWQDLGFHHRRRRTGSKPWQRVSTMKLSRGTYYARMTRGKWSSCPGYRLRLEQLSAVYGPPLLLGARGVNSTAASMSRGAHGGSKQKTTTWWNDWGAINSWTKNGRAQNYGGGHYAKSKETGALNELVLRSEGGGTVIKKVAIDKFNFTADELYNLVGIDKMNLPATFKQWHRYELVIRNTIILPDQGEYVFKFDIDTSFKSSEQAWMSESRRRNPQFQIRAGAKADTGKGGALATFSAWQGTGSKTVSFKASEAGTVTFEASILTDYNAPGDKMLLPSSVLLEVKHKDILHGESLNIGSHTKYMSDLTAIRGDTDVRIDWPERDDPLSSELKTQTFDALPPQALLIGRHEMTGFAAHAEAKIDAGACTSVEAWASNVDKSSTDTSVFWGIALNLCDVDGNNQYFELVTYHPPSAAHKANGANNTMFRVGWVHIGFTQPTHMKVVRNPEKPNEFAVSYRPDNREAYATPFSILDSGYTDAMEVGVSMNSPEAYRYAEFYNISIDDCPISCNDKDGKQLFCGEITTPCGNVLKCGSSCSDGNVCSDEQCMKCPPLALTANQTKWECGEIKQQCVNTKNQKIQLHRHVGTKARPTVLHFCKANVWNCVGQSKWEFLTLGKECGTVTDNCDAQIQLFQCPMLNDVCEAHKCKCTPTAFAQKYNCGTAADGCGRNVVFGSAGGSCPGATDRCISNECCTPKTRNDFNKSLTCGRVSDTCGGWIELSKASPKAYFKTGQTNTWANYYNGQRGMEIEAKLDFHVLSLGRGLAETADKLQEKRRVWLWDVATKKELGSVEVGPDSEVKNKYAWEKLGSGVKLEKGKKYRITMHVERSQKDKYTQGWYHGTTRTNFFNGQFADYKGEVDTQKTTGFPEDHHIDQHRGLGLVNFDVLENEGCGSGPLWTCKADNTCFEKEVHCAKGMYAQPGATTCDSCSGATRRRRAQSCTACAVGKAGAADSDECEKQTGCDFSQSDASGKYCHMWNFRVSGDKFEWRRGTRTPSWGTGPQKGGSKGNGDHFLYIETSSPRRKGDNAILRSNAMKMTGSAKVKFNYNMNGRNLGSLKVNWREGSNVQKLWEKSGGSTGRDNSKDQWIPVAVKLGKFAGKTGTVEFEGVRGTSWSGDLAIDDVDLDAGADGELEGGGESLGGTPAPNLQEVDQGIEESLEDTQEEENPPEESEAELSNEEEEEEGYETDDPNWEAEAAQAEKESLLEEEAEVEGTFVNEDEFALPDLTQD